MANAIVKRPRFYAAAQSFGWGVRDSERGDERVAYFRQGTGTWQEAEALARAEAQRLNESRSGRTDG